MRFSLILAVLCASSILAAPATAPAEETKVVTRVYDINDLLWQINDYPAASGAIPGAAAGENKSSRQELVDNMTKLIEDTVATETWRDNGGADGALREMNGRLI